MTNMVFALVITTAIKFIKHGYEQRILVHTIKTKQLQTELSLLKYQINPHFLFNTLNNLYSMALEHKDQLIADSISRLSHLMRYMIYEANVDQIDIIKEIEQIRRFIELQKLKYSEEDDVKIKFQVDGKLTGIQVPPMLLMPLVENAFKYGISIKKPSNIDINLNIDEGKLFFSVENSIHTTKSQKSKESEVGLMNVRRRLELLYPNAHVLTVQNQGNKFYAGLEIEV